MQLYDLRMFRIYMYFTSYHLYLKSVFNTWEIYILNETQWSQIIIDNNWAMYVVVSKKK